MVSQNISCRGWPCRAGVPNSSRGPLFLLIFHSTSLSPKQHRSSAHTSYSSYTPWLVHSTLRCTNRCTSLTLCLKGRQSSCYFNPHFPDKEARLRDSEGFAQAQSQASKIQIPVPAPTQGCSTIVGADTKAPYPQTALRNASRNTQCTHHPNACARTNGQGWSVSTDRWPPHLPHPSPSQAWPKSAHTPGT